MTPSSTALKHTAALAFDTLAKDYDDLFTRSLIGRAQRGAVWKQAAQTFSAGDHVLELNCGTGEDAFFLSQMGISVTACDASEEMIALAKHRRKREAPQSSVWFTVIATEDLKELSASFQADGVFSNFSGLNCVADLAEVARQLATHVKSGAPLLLCLSTRYCLWEILWFLAHGKFRKAFRRCGGQATVQFGEVAVQVQYPTVRCIRRLFSPAFALRSYSGVGITVPPSYLEPWAHKHPRIFRGLCRVDRAICNLAWFRVVGDHVLLSFESVAP